MHFRLDRTVARSRATTLPPRTTTIKVVSVDRDVTLLVACRSTFIAVIQPRIERPTAERRNGNTQWLSRKPASRSMIARLHAENRHPMLLWTPQIAITFRSIGPETDSEAHRFFPTNIRFCPGAESSESSSSESGNRFEFQLSVESRHGIIGALLVR